MRRWGWTRRRAPIPREGPPPAPAPQIDTAAPPLPTGREFDTAAPSLAAAPQIETAAPCLVAVPQAAAGDDASAPGEPDDRAIVPRLQSAVARVLPAIEAIVAKLGAGPTHPREMERAARALAALTRTLRELNSLLSQRQAAAADDVAATTTTCLRTSTRSVSSWRGGSMPLSRPAPAQADAAAHCTAASETLNCVVTAVLALGGRGRSAAIPTHSEWVRGLHISMSIVTPHPIVLY